MNEIEAFEAHVGKIITLIDGIQRNMTMAAQTQAATLQTLGGICVLLEDFGKRLAALERGWE